MTSSPTPSTSRTLVAEGLHATITDTLPDEVVFVSASDGGTNTSGVVTWPAVALNAAGVASPDGDVATGASGTSVQRSVTVRVLPTATTSVTNRARVSAPDPQAPSTPLTAEATDVDLLRRLDVAKTNNAPATGITDGGTVTYTVTLTNVGTGDYIAGTPATLLDDLSGVLDDATFVTGSATIAVDGAAPTPLADPVAGSILWTGSLAAGDTAVLTYQVTATPGTGDAPIINRATSAKGTSCDPATSLDQNGASCAVTTDYFAASILKSVQSVTQNVDGRWTVVYALDVTNLNVGESVAYTLADTLTFGMASTSSPRRCRPRPRASRRQPGTGSDRRFGLRAGRWHASLRSHRCRERSCRRRNQQRDVQHRNTRRLREPGGPDARRHRDHHRMGMRIAGRADREQDRGPPGPERRRRMERHLRHQGDQPVDCPRRGLTYTLEDSVTLPAGVDVVSVTVAAPPGVAINPAFDGTAVTALMTAADDIEAAPSTMTPATRSFNITYTVDVPRARGDASDIACPPAGTGGYANTVTLLAGTSTTALDTADACTT